jgi:hypothetical protein
LVHLARGGIFSDPIENCDTHSGGVKATASTLDVARGSDAGIGDEKSVSADSPCEFADTVNGAGAEDHARARLKIETDGHGHTRWIARLL